MYGNGSKNLSKGKMFDGKGVETFSLDLIHRFAVDEVTAFLTPISKKTKASHTISRL